MSDRISVNQVRIDDFYARTYAERAAIEDIVKRVGAVYNAIGSSMTGAVVNATQEFNVQAAALSHKLDEVLESLRIALSNHASTAASIESGRVAQIG